MNEKKKHQIDRREFLLKSLKGFGAGITLATPLEMYLMNVVSGVFSSATALASGTQSDYSRNNYVALTMPGGPSRWYFDLPLKPNGNDAFRYSSTNDHNNSMVINRLVSGSGISGNFKGDYGTFQVGENHLPWMWSGQLPTPGGGSVPAAHLANMMAMLRGLDEIDSHELGRYLQLVPVGNASLLGLVGDKSIAPIPAVGVGGTATSPDYYYSDAGVAIGDGSNGVSNLFSAFSGGTNLISTAGSTAEAIDQVINLMSSKAQQRGLSRFVLSKNTDRINARKLMNLQFANFNSVQTAIESKYQNLITRSLSDPACRVDGIDNTLIAGDQTAHYKVSVNNRMAYYTGSDIREITNASSNISNLARGMAVAEFMLTGAGQAPQSFSSSLHIIIGGLTGVTLQSAQAPATEMSSAQSFTNVNFAMPNDAHEIGSVIAMTLFSRYFRAIAACEYELMQKLKTVSVGGGQNMADFTCITNNAEFNRRARDNAGGADHGADACVTSIVNGRIASNIVAGDIRVGTTGGTWGVAAPMPEFLGQTGLIGNVASTLATMLEFQTPTENNPSFLTLQNGKFVSAVHKAKNVA